MGYSSKVGGLMWVIVIVTLGMIVQMHLKKKKKMSGECMGDGSVGMVWGWRVDELSMGVDKAKVVLIINMILMLVGVIVCGVWIYEAKYKKGGGGRGRRRSSKKEGERKTIRPRNWPIMGCQVEAYWNFYRLHDWCHKFFSTHTRTVELKFFTTRIYLTVDPANVEHILRTNFRNYPKGKRTIEKMKDLLGDGIFNADGESWIKQRKVASAVFNGKSLRESSILSFRKDALCLLANLHSATLNGRPVNIYDLFFSMTMDSICRVGFGIQGGRLFTMRSKFTNAFDKASTMISKRFVNVFWKVHKAFKVGTEKILIEELSNLNSFTLEVIANRRAELINLLSTQTDSNNFCSKANADLLSKLLKIGGDLSTKKSLRDSIINFILAGRDTTAVTMSWFIYNICEKQDVADKIYQEVESMISCGSSLRDRPKSSLTFGEVANCLTIETLSNMHYLHAAITETLRLYPAVARDTKVAIQDDTLPDGTCIKRGDHVAYVPYSMGRMEFLWGCDALEFKPERWLKDGHFNQVSPFMFTPFQAGPRMCPGKDWAYLQMKMTMALLIYFFEFRLVPNHVIRYKVTMVLAMVNGLQVAIHNRENL